MASLHTSHTSRAIPIKIAVVDRLQTGRDVCIESKVEQMQSWVDEIRLPLKFVRSQAWSQAQSVGQFDTKQPDVLTTPVTEFRARKVRVR